MILESENFSASANGLPTYKLKSLGTTEDSSVVPESDLFNIANTNFTLISYPDFVSSGLAPKIELIACCCLLIL